MATAPIRRVVSLVSYTKGVPYLRDAIDPTTGREAFTGWIDRALTSSQGLIQWWAQKDRVVALWSWFAALARAAHTSAPTITPILAGFLNGDARQVAYEISNGNASLQIAWFKNLWPASNDDGSSASTDTTTQYETVGMPAIFVNSPGGASRLLGFIPKAAEAGDLGSEILTGTFGWDSFCGPLARYIVGNLVVLARQWEAGEGTEGASAINDQLDAETKRTLESQGAPKSPSNQNQIVGEGPGKVPVEGESASAAVAKKPIAGSSATLVTDGETSAATVEAVEAAPGLVPLVMMSLFTYVPKLLQGKLQYIDLRLEVVSSLDTDVAWRCEMAEGGVVLQQPSQPTIPAMQRVVMTDASGTRQVLTSHAAQFEVQNDTRGSNPLQMVLNLTVGAIALAAVVCIGKSDVRAWVGESGPDAQLVAMCQAADQLTGTVGDVTLAINVCSDPRAELPPNNGSTVATYSAIVHLTPSQSKGHAA